MGNNVTLIGSLFCLSVRLSTCQGHYLEITWRYKAKISNKYLRSIGKIKLLSQHNQKIRAFITYRVLLVDLLMWNPGTVDLSIRFEFQLDISKRSWDKGSWQTNRQTDRQQSDIINPFFLKSYGTLKILQIYQIVLTIRWLTIQKLVRNPHPHPSINPHVQSTNVYCEIFMIYSESVFLWVRCIRFNISVYNQRIVWYRLVHV